MSFPQYPKYKDSGVNWLGDIPEGWDLCRYKQVFRERDERSVTGDEMLLSVSAYTGVTPRSEIIDESDTLVRAESLEGYKICYPNDLVVNIMLAWNRGLGITRFDGVVSPSYAVFTPIGRVDPWFAHYLVRSDRIIGYFEAFSTGVIDSRLRLYPDVFGSLSCALPPIEEQVEIRLFLDQQTEKIDALIEEQRRLLKLLKEKRQAAIAHVFDGNIDHLAKAVGRVKDAVSFVTSGPRGWSDLVGESGALFVQSGDLDDDLNVDFAKCKRVQVEDNAETLRTRLRNGDVAVCITGAKTGNVAVMDHVPETAYVNQHICLLRPKDGVLPRYLAFALKSKAGQAYFDLMQYGMKQGLSLGNVRNAPLPLPSLAQQKESVRRLDSTCKELDQVEREARSSILLLQERRSAIISAAVTGKIDVRQRTKKPVASVKPYNSGFAHQLLAATILERCNDKHMGRVKLQKLIHVTEYHAQIEDLKGEYTRQMAGPLDMKAMAGLERGLEKQHWYKTVREGQRYRYQPLEKKDQHQKYLEQWTDKRDRIDEVVTLMGGMNMRQCEIVSTLYAAWNDLLIDGMRATDDAILHQAATAEGWHESKERTPRDKWVSALQWMRQHALIPTGFGSHTRKASPEGVHEPA